MIKKIFTVLSVCMLMFHITKAQLDFPAGKYPLHVIFDTDFGPDYDDVGAITILHDFADSGYVKILATIASTRHKNVAAALNAFNTYFGRPEIPVGVVNDSGLAFSDRQHWTDTIVNRYPHKIKSNQDAVDAVTLYRRILSKQPDHSVTIITVGFLTNLSNLLNSKPDANSPLDGYHLVKNKVFKLVTMGGAFPKGEEYNFNQDVKSTTNVLNHWPTTILFSGVEIGAKIFSGLALIHDQQIKNSPVKDVFLVCIPFSAEDSAGRMSFDETAVLIAVKGWQDYYTLKEGRCVMYADGHNEWDNKPGKHAYIIEKKPPAYVEAIINHLIMR